MICQQCHQVIPKTEAEINAAAEKAAIAMERIAHAEQAWNVFRNAHPIDGFWARNPAWGISASMITAVLAYMACVEIGIRSDFPVEGILLGAFVAFLVGVTLAYALVKRPKRIFDLHNQEIRNAFALQYKEHAECLGIEVVRS